MACIYCFSGPCGCGKSTLSAAFAAQLAQEGKRVYTIHGDDFHAGFTGDALLWDAELTERALFLREKLTHLPENRDRLLDNTGLTVQQELAQLDMVRFLISAPVVTNRH